VELLGADDGDRLADTLYSGMFALLDLAASAARVATAAGALPPVPLPDVISPASAMHAELQEMADSAQALAHGTATAGGTLCVDADEEMRGPMSGIEPQGSPGLLAGEEASTGDNADDRVESERDLPWVALV
jgi:hypothetical protein